MSVQSEINRIQTNIDNAFDEIEAKGVTVSDSDNSDTLAARIADIDVYQRGSIIYNITNRTSGSYIIDGVEYTRRIALSNIATNNNGATDVRPQDWALYSNYILFLIKAVDDTYAYSNSWRDIRGDQGTSITSITKDSTDVTSEAYTITFSNGTTQALTIPRGATGPAGTTDYNQLSNKPTIPTKVSLLTNDSNFATTTLLTNGSVTKIGTTTKGASNLPIYLNAGVPTAVTSLSTAYLKEPVCRNYGLAPTPTVMSLVDSLKGCKTFGIPEDHIIVEKTIDGGVTWEPYSSNYSARNLFNYTRASTFILPKDANNLLSVNCGIRIIITAMNYNIPEGTNRKDYYQYWNSSYIKATERYVGLNGFFIWCSAGGNSMNLVVEAAKGNDSNNWVSIWNNPTEYLTGGAGANYIQLSVTLSLFGGSTSQTYNYWNYRFTFWQKGVSNSTTNWYGNNINATAAQVFEISGYGPSVWNAPNNIVRYNHLYGWDSNLNVTFPANIKATGTLEATSNLKIGSQTLTESKLQYLNDINSTTFKGDKGDTGAAFTYDMFTADQLAALKGSAGQRGSLIITLNNNLNSESGTLDNGFVYINKITKSNVKNYSGLTDLEDVYVGDHLFYNGYLYHVGYTSSSTCYVDYKFPLQGGLIIHQNTLMLLETGTINGFNYTYKASLALIKSRADRDIQYVIEGDWLQYENTLFHIGYVNGNMSYINYTLNIKGDPGTTDYNLLTNKPTIPTKTSDLEHDSDFAYTSNIPTKTSLLTNDSSYVKTWEVKENLNPYLLTTNNMSCINIGAESNANTTLPFIWNDLAHVDKTGTVRLHIGTYDATANYMDDNVVNALPEYSDLDLSDLFDGSTSYKGYWTYDENGTALKIGGNKVVIIDIESPESMTNSCKVYISFGAVSWAASNIDIYSKYITYNTLNDPWGLWASVRDNTNCIWFSGVTAHQAIDNEGNPISGNNYNNRFRFVIWGLPALLRINQIGIIAFNSAGARNGFMSRGCDDYLYRNFTPGKTETYNLGSSNKQWDNVYTNNLVIGQTTLNLSDLSKIKELENDIVQILLTL